MGHGSDRLCQSQYEQLQLMNELKPILLERRRAKHEQAKVEGKNNFLPNKREYKVCILITFYSQGKIVLHWLQIQNVNMKWCNFQITRAVILITA